MGVLTDFVVAAPGDAKRVGESLCPSRDFHGLDAKGMDEIKLGTLAAILTGEDYDASFMGNQALRFAASEEGPWVFELPGALVNQLATLKDDELSSVASKWGETEELSSKYENWPAEAVKQMLVDLVALSKRAVSEGNALLMWVCL